MRVVPATGRARAGAWTEHVLNEPALFDGLPGIYVNGCKIFHDHGLLETAALPQDVARDVLSLADDELRGRARLVVYTGTEALVSRKDSFADKLAAVGDAPMREAPDLAAAVSASQVMKMLFITDDDPSAAAEVRGLLETVVKDRSLITSAVSWCVEVVPAGVNKGLAAQRLLEQWQVPADLALAIGDGENDVELLQFCGTGVAMANGVQAVKDVATYVAPANHLDGWAEVMEDLVLSPLSGKAVDRRHLWLPA